MNPLLVLFGYVTWHYSTGILDVLRVWGNFLWFIQHFFSLPTLVSTLFAPWKRLHEEYSKEGIIDGEFFENFVVNMIMRIVGMLVRAATIVIALLLLVSVLLGGLLFFAFWIIAPFATLALCMYGLGVLGITTT